MSFTRTLCIVFVTLLAACASSERIAGTIVVPAEAGSGSQAYKLGDTTVRIVTTKYRSGGFVFVALHENEGTSVAVARQVLARSGGTLVELKHAGSRNVTFSHNGKGYTIDPNRIFSEKGIAATLKPAGSPEVKALVKGLAQAIRAKLRGSVVSSLHNNTNGSYSVTSYLSNLKRDASEVYINPAKDADDFFFVTNGRLFQALKAGGYNVVLQSRSVTDDGSLSVAVARSGTPYVNVEAQSGHGAEQVRMLQALLGD